MIDSVSTSVPNLEWELSIVRKERHPGVNTIRMRYQSVLIRGEYIKKKNRIWVLSSGEAYILNRRRLTTVEKRAVGGPGNE